MSAANSVRGEPWANCPLPDLWEDFGRRRCHLRQKIENWGISACKKWGLIWTSESTTFESRINDMLSYSLPHQHGTGCPSLLSPVQHSVRDLEAIGVLRQPWWLQARLTRQWTLPRTASNTHLLMRLFRDWNTPIANQLINTTTTWGNMRPTCRENHEWAKFDERRRGAKVLNPTRDKNIWHEPGETAWTLEIAGRPGS